ILSYQLPSADAKPIVLRHDFEFPADPADLHKVMLSVRPDDSWHRMSITLDVAGRHWVSDLESHSGYMAQNRPISLLFQPPTFEDQTFKNKIWIKLHDAGVAPEANRGN